MAPRWLVSAVLVVGVACRGPHPASRPPASGPVARAAPEVDPTPDAGQLPTALRRARPERDIAVEGGPCVVGVPECDEYLAKFYVCVTQQIPETQREAMEQALRSTCESLRQAALSPSGRPGLSQACLTALSSARQAMTAFGCTW